MNRGTRHCKGADGEGAGAASGQALASTSAPAVLHELIVLPDHAQQKQQPDGVEAAKEVVLQALLRSPARARYERRTRRTHVGFPHPTRNMESVLAKIWLNICMAIDSLRSRCLREPERV
jgi:hypothetical protein